MESPRKSPAPRPRRLATSPLVIGATIGVLATVSVGLGARFASPPRYDGAGYAILGLGLSQGLGYVELNHPDRPPHAHFPPGYPLVLALLFRAVGPSNGMIHGLSIILTVAAILVYGRWFRSLYPPSTAVLLGLALALNWTWGRIGGAIQSEPLFLLLGAIIVAIHPWASRQGPRGGFALGVLLASAILTRHVGVCLFVAVSIDLALARRWATLATSSIVVAALLAPWLSWLGGSGRTTQAGLFSAHEFVTNMASQAIFYVRRIPDQLIGPVVEVATVFARSPRLSWISTVAALGVSAPIVWGWVRLLRNPRRRMAGLVPLATLPLLLVWPFTEAGRFLIPLVPFLVLGAMEGLAPLGTRLAFKHPRRLASAIVLLLSFPYTLYSLASGRASAQEATHEAFDSACAWIVAHGDRPGPVLGRYPADLFWQTGRQALELSGAPGSIDDAIHRYDVAYLVVDETPYANATKDPLALFVEKDARRTTRVWGPVDGVSVHAPSRAGATRPPPTPPRFGTPRVKGGDPGPSIGKSPGFHMDTFSDPS